MKQLLKIVLILFDSPSSQCTDKKKTCFCVLWFNYELKTETGNEKHKTKCPTNSQLWLNISKQNTVYFISFSKEEKDMSLQEVYNVKTLEVYNVKTLQVYNVKTLEVFIY